MSEESSPMGTKMPVPVATNFDLPSSNAWSSALVKICFRPYLSTRPFAKND